MGSVSFDAAQRSGQGEDFQVLVDGTVVATIKPAGSAYQVVTTASFTVSAGTHTLTFQGLDTAGGDNTALLDAVTVAVAAPVAPAVGDSGFESVKGKGKGTFYFLGGKGKGTFYFLGCSLKSRMSPFLFAQLHLEEGTYSRPDRKAESEGVYIPVNTYFTVHPSHSK